MSRHLEKILEHAEKKLALAHKDRPKDLLELYQNFLKIEEHRIRLRHNAGGGGREIARLRVSLIDVVLAHLFRDACRWAKTPGLDSGLVLVADGGYGRGELNPFSDVDIMFLFAGRGEKPMARQNEIIEHILYLLWDMGFKVGHSTRSVKSAVLQANADPLSKTSLLESRPVAGDRALFEKFQTAFQAKCVRGHENEYIRWRVGNQLERHAKFENTITLQEPNIKSGCGGLRDYQNLNWMSFFKVGTGTTAGLVEKKFLSESERRRLEVAYDFLLRVRTELHYLNGRGTDVLTLFFQGRVATKFNYPQRTILRRSEEFMRDYYRHAREIYLLTATVSERLSLPLRTAAPKRVFGFLAKRVAKREEFDGFYAENGLLFPESREIFKTDPDRMMRAFLHIQQRQIAFSPDLLQLIRRRVRLVNRTFQYAKTVRETFQAILTRKGEVGRILRLMHEADLLGRYLPEFGGLTCLVQHEFFHRYTADEHTLVCIDKLDALIDTEDPKLRGYRELFSTLEDTFVLYLAILLHDTGKSAGGRHHAEESTLFAHKVARRLQLSAERRRLLIFLVDNHMLLSETAQRRNLDDNATIEEFAGVVRNQDNLDALMLLTLADGLAVGGEAVWSDWKESLVWILYRRTTGFLADSRAFYEERRTERKQLREETARRLGPSYSEEVVAHFQSMPNSYFRAFEAPEIVAHIKLFRTFLRHLAKREPRESLSPSVKWTARIDQAHSEVAVCTWDREALLARIACSFAIARINILSADIYTRGDNLVLDVFRVCDTDFQAVTDERDQTLFEVTLSEFMLNPDFDFTPLLQNARKRTAFHLSQEIEFPTRISIRNDVHPTYTLIDIQTPDRLGLLYDLLRAIASTGANIGLSRVATEKGAAIDTFYVTDHLDNKITRKSDLDRLQSVLHQAAVPIAPMTK